jgi:molybdate-binding protein
LSLEVSFMGSLHAIKVYAAGRAELAGFHFPVAGSSHSPPDVLLSNLQNKRDRLIRFVDREQGLILPAGNPLKVRSFRDIVRKRLRFINRQPGSGTRILIDQIVADEKLETSGIVGYGTEEFTHRAVAATVAAGGADVGVGLRAAAAEHRLAFVPLVQEHYFLAVRANALQSAPVLQFIASLRSPWFERVVRGFAGYRSDAAGSIVGLDALS